MTTKKKSKITPRVCFPQSELWNEVRKLMQFPAVVNHQPVLCTITYDALVARYAAPAGPNKYAALDTFKANRSSIESLVELFLKKGDVNLDKEVGIKPAKMAWRPAAVCFPTDPSERWEFDRESVSFPAIAGEKRIQCLISYEALCTRYGARGNSEESTALEVFRANRASIQSLVSLLIEEGRADENNVLVIKSGDVLKEYAGIWKNDPTVDDMLADIYHRRGRPMTEDGQ